MPVFLWKGKNFSVVSLVFNAKKAMFFVQISGQG